MNGIKTMSNIFIKNDIKDNCHYRAVKTICKSKIQENPITINRFDCVIQHNNSIK